MFLPLGDFCWGSGLHSVSDVGFRGDLVIDGGERVPVVLKSGSFLRILRDFFLPHAEWFRFDFFGGFWGLTASSLRCIVLVGSCSYRATGFKGLGGITT